MAVGIDDAVPFLDLVSPHRVLADELIAVFQSALRTAAFVGGAEVAGFEEHVFIAPQMELAIRTDVAEHRGARRDADAGL